MKNQEKKQTKKLLKKLQRVVKELNSNNKFNFQIQSIEEKFKKYYIPVDRKQGDRCVDDRADKPFAKYPYDQGKYNGRQFAGGTFGIIGALRATTEINENDARDLVKEIYDQQGWKIGDHIDDEHGQITDPKQLQQRNKGCGNQDAIKKGDVPMYAFVTAGEVKDRFKWIRNINGYLPVLTGGHEAQGAAVNLTKGTTFGTVQAVDENQSLFNLDLAEAYQIAEVFSSEVKKTEQQFIEDFTEAVITDYLQTLAALNGPTQIQYRI